MAEDGLHPHLQWHPLAPIGTHWPPFTISANAQLKARVGIGQSFSSKSVAWQGEEVCRCVVDSLPGQQGREGKGKAAGIMALTSLHISENICKAFVTAVCSILSRIWRRGK